jgi:hypothetical protein
MLVELRLEVRFVPSLRCEEVILHLYRMEVATVPPGRVAGTRKIGSVDKATKVQVEVCVPMLVGVTHRPLYLQKTETSAKVKVKFAL